MKQEAAIPTDRRTEIAAVVQRAQAGDESAVPMLRELLEEFPHLASHFGDLANQALAIWIALAAGNNLYLRESLSAKVAAMRRELAGENPSLVMELAADRAVLSWIAANYHSAMEGNALLLRENPKLLAFRTRRKLQSERAHLNALGALVTLRKLLPASTKPGTTKSKMPALPQHANANAVSNRLSEFFADFSFPTSTAAQTSNKATVK